MEAENAIAYCRVSDPRQVKWKLRDEPTAERDSLDRQEAKARAFAERNGWPLLRVWLEFGESAKTDDRTKLWEMRDWARRNAGTAQVLIIPKIDRFARNMDDYRDLKRVFLRLGIRIASVDERIENTPEGRLQENVLASFAQFDNERRAERSKDGMVEAARAGRWQWPAGFGFRNVKLADSEPNIAPFEPEARLMRRAFELIGFEGRLPYEAYAALRPEGLSLSRAGFYEALRRPVYAGIIRAFGMEARGTGSFVPIVPEELFWRVQGAMAEKGGHHRKTYSLDHPDFPLRGTVRCVCGRYATAAWSTGRSQRYAYYKCADCRGENHPKDVVEPAFATFLDSHRRTEAEYSEISEAIVVRWDAKHSAAIERRRRTAADKERLWELQKAIAMKVAEGVIPDDIGRAQIDDLRARSALAGPAEEADLDPEADVPEVLAFGRRLLVQPGTFWTELRMVEKKRFQRFTLPQGATYRREVGFETTHIRLLKPSGGNLVGNDTAWCTSDDDLETADKIWKGLAELYRMVGRPSGVVP